MAYSKIYSSASTNDIQQTIRYLKNSLKNPDATTRLYKAIESASESLKTFPYKHAIIDDTFLSLYKIRFVRINNYLLFFTITEETKTIYIIRFLYARRDWQHILKKYIKYSPDPSNGSENYVHEEQEQYNKK